MKQLFPVFLLAIISASNVAALDDPKFHIYYINDCNETLQTAIRYKSTGGDWVSKGFWRMKPGDKILVAKTNNRVIYAHYADLDGNAFGDGYRKTVRGRTLDFVKHTFPKQKNPTKPFEYNLNLGCLY